MQNVECVITDFPKYVCHQSNLVHSARVSLHSQRRNPYDTCLQSLLYETARRLRDCGVLYPSDADMQLGGYDYNIQQGVDSILASPDQSLGAFCRDGGPANPQLNNVSLRSTPSK